MRKEYYNDVKYLVVQKQWKTYENLLKDEIDRITSIFKTNKVEDLKMLQYEIMQTLKVLRLPHDLIELCEEDSKSK